MKVDPDNIDRVQENESEHSRHKGVLHRFFTKNYEEENHLTQMNEDIQDDIEEEEEKDLEKRKESSDSNSNLQATLEQFKAQINALGEFRRTTNERFLHLSEEIGQLRESVLTREKEISGLTLKVSKAIDLVEQVHPEKLEELSQHQTTQMTKLSTKVESNRLMGENILIQLKDVRDKTAIFNDVEDILKLNKQITDKLVTIERLETVVDQQSSKVEQFFIKIEQQYQEFERFEHDRKELESSHKGLIKEFDRLKTAVSDTASIKDINKLDEDMQDINQLNLESINSIKKQVAEFEELVNDLNKSNGLLAQNELKLSVNMLQNKTENIFKIVEEKRKSDSNINLILSKQGEIVNDLSQEQKSQNTIFNDFVNAQKKSQELTSEEISQLKKETLSVIENVENLTTKNRDNITSINDKLAEMYNEFVKRTNEIYHFDKKTNNMISRILFLTHTGLLTDALKVFNDLRNEYLALDEDMQSKEMMIVLISLNELINNKSKKNKLIPNLE